MLGAWFRDVLSDKYMAYPKAYRLEISGPGLRFVVIYMRPVRTGSRDGAVVRALASHQCGAGSIPRLGVICGLSLLVLFSAPRGFSPGTPVFPSPQKPTFDLICIDLI